MSTPLSDRSVSLYGPSYNIYRYTDEIYKIVHFKQPRLLLKLDKEPKKNHKKTGSEIKLDAAVSRARRLILEYALCNQWDWFCTFTLDKSKYERFNLDAWHKDFSQWLRDQRKKLSEKIAFLLIPELHKDGAWHMHGLISGMSCAVSFAELRKAGWKLPDKIVKNGYFCWVDYYKKFGFCSLSPVRDPVACGFYITKYISKELSNSDVSVGKHLYYVSRGLDRASLHCDLYGESEELNKYLTNKYEWVDTGMTRKNALLDWTFALSENLLHDCNWSDYGEEAPPDPSEFDYAFDGIQAVMEGF